MEEELQKRNTDCVYFLASPLTCKKGSECEYRHSESARLNPRDCWYWLSGNCLNPTCAFRHPPLDGRPEISFDRFHVPLSTPGAISKTNVPCYFYFNAYCTKGDACPFLHGPDGALPGWKPTKAASAGMDTQAFEKKSSVQIDTGPGSVEERHSLAVSKMVNIQLQSKDVGQVEASNNLIEHSLSPQISVPDCEEGAGKLLDPLPSVAHFVNNERPLLCSDQSSEEPAADCVEPEERWESSPGFDVLVDDGSDQLGYEDDAEYLLGHDGEAGRRLHRHLLNYDYEDQVRYDPMDFPSAGILYENGVYDSYDCMENNNLSEHVRRIPEQPRGRMLERKTSRRRKLMRRESEVDYRNGDLRDHLRKRKRDSHHTSFSSQKHGSSSHIIEGSRKRSMRQTVGRRLNGRLASEANSESESGLNGTNRPCRPRGSRSKHSRPRLGKERRKTNGRELPHLSSEISRDVTLKSTDPTLESTAFTGPKTLAQIKEEKRRARINEDDTRSMGNPLWTYRCQGMPGDFQGPKPLSELIKHKKEKLGSENENVGFYHILS